MEVCDERHRLEHAVKSLDFQAQARCVLVRVSKEIKWFITQYLFDLAGKCKLNLKLSLNTPWHACLGRKC